VSQQNTGTHAPSYRRSTNSLIAESDRLQDHNSQKNVWSSFMVQSKFSDLQGRSIGGSLIKTIREEERGTIEIQTLTGSCYDFPNLTHVYPKLDAKSAAEAKVVT